LLKNRLSDFQTPILGAGNCSCSLPSIDKKPDDSNRTLQDLDHVTSVTDVIAEMFGQKICVVQGKGCVKSQVKKLFYEKYIIRYYCRLSEHGGKYDAVKLIDFFWPRR